MPLHDPEAKQVEKQISVNAFDLVIYFNPNSQFKSSHEVRGKRLHTSFLFAKKKIAWKIIFL